MEEGLKIFFVYSINHDGIQDYMHIVAQEEEDAIREFENAVAIGYNIVKAEMVADLDKLTKKEDK